MTTPYVFRANPHKLNIVESTLLQKIVTNTAYISIGSVNPLSSFSVELELRPEPLNEDDFIKRFSNCRRVVVQLHYELEFKFDPVFVNTVNKTCFSFKGDKTLSELQFFSDQGRHYELHNNLKFYGETDTGDRFELFAEPGESIDFEFKFYTRR